MGCLQGIEPPALKGVHLVIPEGSGWASRLAVRCSDAVYPPPQEDAGARRCTCVRQGSPGTALPSHAAPRYLCLLQHVTHMDLKSGNTLLTSRGPGGTAKLADVALSRMQTRTFLSDVPMVGTFAWWVGGQQCMLAHLLLAAIALPPSLSRNARTPPMHHLQGGSRGADGRPELHRGHRHLLIRGPPVGNHHRCGTGASNNADMRKKHCVTALLDRCYNCCACCCVVQATGR